MALTSINGEVVDVREITPQQAWRTVIPFGVHEGKKIGQLAREGGDGLLYLDWARSDVWVRIRYPDFVWAAAAYLKVPAVSLALAAAVLRENGFDVVAANMARPEFKVPGPVALAQGGGR